MLRSGLATVVAISPRASAAPGLTRWDMPVTGVSQIGGATRPFRRRVGQVMTMKAAAVPILVVAALASCVQPSHPASGPPTWKLAHGRFTVKASADAIATAAAAHVDLHGVVQRTLDLVDRRLPGPPTVIAITHDAHVIPEVGTNGFTDPRTGRVSIEFTRVGAVSFNQTLTFWLPRVLAHELDHSVRILAGPGYGNTLLDAMVSEGLADNFDTSVFPGSPQPWDVAITHDQAGTLWQQAQPMLANDSLSVIRGWLFGDGTIPRWTAYTLGYQLVAGYLARHPDTDIAAATRRTSAEILAGSGFPAASTA